MENLVPREFYDIDDSGYRERLGLVTGVTFGLGFGVACFFLTRSIIGLRWTTLLSVFAAVFAGLAFGKSFPRGFRKKMSSMLDRLYAGDPEITDPPTSGKDLLYRLPCSWKRSENFTVGGILYLGPQELLFVPHKLNLPADRSVMEMGPTKHLELSLTNQRLAGILKVLIPRPIPQLQVIWPGGSAKFLIPAPNRVLKRIQERIHEMA
jgi:hypothetical protein